MRLGRRGAAAIFAAALLASVGIPMTSGLPGDLRFAERTREAKLTSATPALDPMKGAYIHGAAWGDVNGDDVADLFVGTFTDSAASYYLQRGATGPMPNRLFLGVGRGRFAPAPAAYADVIGTSGRVSGAAFADLDADGDDDLVVIENRRGGAGTANPAQNQPNRLYRNDGGGFVDVTATSGINPPGFAAGRGVLVWDADGDGCLDLYVVTDQFSSNTGPGRLLDGDCALQFTDVTTAAGLASAQGHVVQGLGAAVGDVDDDGDPDLFVAGGPRVAGSGNARFRYYRRNFLFTNDGDGTFTEVSGGTLFDEATAPNPGNDWTSGGAFGDLDRDGRLDLVVSHHYESAQAGVAAKAPKVWMNRTEPGGPVTFVDVTTASGIQGVMSKSPHIELTDIDNNGWVDVYLSVEVDTADGPAPLVFFNQGAADGVPLLQGPPGYVATGDRRYFAAAPLGDVENDGRLEPFGGAWDPQLPSVLYRNLSDPRRWLDVRVVDGATDLVGARVEVYRRRRAGSPAHLLFAGQSQIGNGFSSAGRPIVHVGLGSHAYVDVIVRPPFGAPLVTLLDVRANQRLVLDVAAPPVAELSATPSSAPPIEETTGTSSTIPPVETTVTTATTLVDETTSTTASTPTTTP